MRTNHMIDLIPRFLGKLTVTFRPFNIFQYCSERTTEVKNSEEVLSWIGPSHVSLAPWAENKRRTNP